MCKKVVLLVMVGLLLGAVTSGPAAELAHRWSFNGDLKDSAGGQDAVLVDQGASDAIFSDTDVTLTGGGKETSDYIDLPDGIVSSLGDSVTIEVWATQLSVQNWSRIFDFGSGTSHNVFMSWTMGTGLGSDRVEWLGPNSNTTSDNTNGPYELGVEYHIVCVFEPGVVTWYTAPAGDADLGAAKGSFETANALSGLEDTNCWLGRSQWPDNTANASYNECRLWVGALSLEELEKMHDLGPDGLSQGVASDPSPADAALDVLRDTLLSWEAGKYAVAHDVYLGTSWDDVNDASRTEPRSVLVSQGQTAATFGPDTVLAFGQTYYWRVDEVNAAPDNAIFTGEVWSFTVEPFAYPIENIIATSNGSSEEGIVPTNTINGSGLDADDQHSTDAADMWAAKSVSADPLYIQYEFDRVYKLYDLMVWNHNSMFEPMLGFGFKDVTIEVSEDGVEWAALKDMVFAQGTAKADYTANTIVDLEGVSAKFVRLTANSGYGPMGTFGLAEVRFSYVPVLPREPQPADGATDVSVDTLLDWRAGREAVSHEVALGSDPEALAVVDTVADSQYNPGGLDLGVTYYWQVTEVNDAEAISAWEGDLWSFMTQEYIVIDDFEGYDDDENRVYESWVDGYGIATNGSQVGYLEAPFAEQTDVYSGKQAMPLFYENTGSAAFAEAELTLPTAQNWARAGIATLVVHVRGALENDAANAYVKVDNTKIANLSASTVPVWKALAIDLAASGASLSNVTKVTIGVEGSGSGVLYVDDVRLYGASVATVVPADPGTDALEAHYAFEGDVADSSGNGYDATSADSLFFEAAPGDLGQAMFFDGIDDHITLPIGTLISTLSDMTIATWVNFSNEGGAWQRIFDFGSGTESYFMLSPRQGMAGPMTFAVKNTPVPEKRFVAPDTLASGWHHVAVVIDSATMNVDVYLDGVVVASDSTPLLPKDLGETTQNWLGRSQWPDAMYSGLMADVRIYSQALSAGEVRYLAGDR